ncbi:MAG: MFS transporter [Candidatus Tectomicrobia bacterium]|nr:MFS transporter [Candidatus Tectomicrobia bacterium]
MQQASPRQHTDGLYYGWVVVALSSYLVFLISGVVFAFGIFFPSFEAEFGWSRSRISLAISLHMFVYGVVQIIIGRCMDRYGVRRVLLVSLLCIGVGSLAMAAMRSLWQLYLFYGVVVAAGYGGSGVVAQAVIAARWFARRLGLALALIFAGIGGGQLTIFPLVVRGIDAYGWPTTYGVLGGGFLVLVVPLLLLFMKEQPRDVGADLDGAALPQHHSQAPLERAVGVLDACRTQAFWMLLLGFTACGFTWSMMTAHLVVLALDLGFSRQLAALSMGLVSAISVGGMLVAGSLSDRIGRRLPLSVSYAMRGLAMLYLTTVRETVGLMIFVVLFGLTFTSTIPLTSSFVRDLYGKLSVGGIFGVIAGAHQVGAVLGPVYAGYVYDTTGNYTVALYVSSAILGAATLLILLLRQIDPEQRGLQPVVGEPQARSL